MVDFVCALEFAIRSAATRDTALNERDAPSEAMAGARPISFYFEK